MKIKKPNSVQKPQPKETEVQRQARYKKIREEDGMPDKYLVHKPKKGKVVVKVKLPAEPKVITNGPGFAGYHWGLRGRVRRYFLRQYHNSAWLQTQAEQRRKDPKHVMLEPPYFVIDALTNERAKGSSKEGYRDKADAVDVAKQLSAKNGGYIKEKDLQKIWGKAP